jgi:hypothetical protein
MVHQGLRISSSGELESVGQLRMPAHFTLHLQDDDEGGPDIALTWQIRGGVPECVEVHIMATETGHEVRVTGLRGVRVEDLLDSTIKWMMSQHRMGGDAPTWFSFAEGSREAIGQVQAARASRKVKITDDLLQEVAKVYRANASDRPTQAVASHFDRGHSAAALYIKRARERGFLGPAIKGKAGEQ